MTVTKSAIAVRGIRGRGPAGRDSFIVETDPSGNFRFGRKSLLATKQDIVSGNIAPAVQVLQYRGGTPGRKPGALEVLFDTPMDAGDALPASLTGSKLECAVAPTADYTVTLAQNGVSIGTGKILASATTGAWTFAAAVSFADNDHFTLTCPAADATLSGLGYLIRGTRTQ